MPSIAWMNELSYSAATCMRVRRARSRAKITEVFACTMACTRGRMENSRGVNEARGSSKNLTWCYLRRPTCTDRPARSVFEGSSFSRRASVSKTDTDKCRALTSTASAVPPLLAATACLVATSGAAGSTNSAGRGVQGFAWMVATGCARANISIAHRHRPRRYHLTSSRRPALCARWARASISCRVTSGGHSSRAPITPVWPTEWATCACAAILSRHSSIGHRAPVATGSHSTVLQG